MDKRSLEKLLEAVRSGEVSPGEGATRIAGERPDVYEDLAFAKVDHGRGVRQGFCEVIYCPGKSVEQVAAVAEKILATSEVLLATRGDRKIFEAISRIAKGASFHEASGAITVEKRKRERRGNVLVLSAGTTDIPVAEEAAVTADIMGCGVKSVYDVGVAGIHRLMDQRGALEEADCVVVAAGMDGALASVVGGMVRVPVVAVPTSVGYGASFGGIAALLSMLNSCAAGIAVMNIDNGFGAGALAYRIVSLMHRGRTGEAW